MPNKDHEGGSSKGLIALGTPISSSDIASRMLKSRSDISYHFFDGVELDNIVSRQSLFHGVLFRNCIIRDCDFSRCDFEGARFESCELLNVSFETADVRSTNFGKSKLISCTMRSSACADNIYKDCIIENCEFEDASVMRCNFYNCDIQNLKNRMASWLHTTFVKSNLKQLSFTDCTASYTIYDNCTFKDVVINADALGLSFGLSAADLENLKFGFLGRTYDTGHSPSPNEFLEEYQRRGWYFQSHILTLNFAPERKLGILLALLNQFADHTSSKSGIKRDDVEFLFRVMNHLKTKHQLPYAAALFAHDVFSKIFTEASEFTIEASVSEFGFQQAFYLASEMYQDLVRATSAINDDVPDQVVEATLTYASKPDISTITYLNCVRSITNQENKSAKLIEARQGSWIEIIQLTLGALFALYAALYLVNGCLVQMTMVRARTKKLFAKRLPSKFLQAASDPRHELPKAQRDILLKLLLSTTGDTQGGDALNALTEKDVESMLIKVRQFNT